MKPSESRKLKVGDRVVWILTSPHVAGTVTDTGYAGLTVQYDDGQVGTISHNDAVCIGREKERQP